MDKEFRLSNGKMLEIVKNNITKPTWKVHGVIDNPKANSTVYHTHGLGMYDSLELELNLPLSLKDACWVLNKIGLKIANGERLKENEKIENILACSFVIKKVKGICKNDIDILRVIIPDENGNYPWNKDCKEIYDKQLS